MDIDSAECGEGAVVGAEVIPEPVLLRRLTGGGEEDHVLIVGAVEQDLAEGGVHGGVVELREFYSIGGATGRSDRRQCAARQLSHGGRGESVPIATTEA